MAREFRITEDDLIELERFIPQFCEVMSRSGCSNADRTALRRVKRVLSDVRWDYGPPTLVAEIPADGEGGTQES